MRVARAVQRTPPENLERYPSRAVRSQITRTASLPEGTQDCAALRNDCCACPAVSGERTSDRSDGCGALRTNFVGCLSALNFSLTQTSCPKPVGTFFFLCFLLDDFFFKFCKAASLPDHAYRSTAAKHIFNAGTYVCHRRLGNTRYAFVFLKACRRKPDSRELARLLICNLV